MAPPNLKKMLQVKIKPRQDSYSDQFNRILMVKMLMLTAAVTGISWMKDTLNCIVPKNHDLSGKFASRACWINGLYIYRELKSADESFYYGVPKDVRHDGLTRNGDLCATKDLKRQRVAGCDPLEKTFFLQYQYFPIAVAALSFLYYLPYLLFRLINADLQQIKEMIKDKSADDFDYDEILKKCFSRKGKNSVSHMRARVFFNIVVKVLYVVANLVSMIVIDSTVNGYFMGFGGNWSTWSKRTNAGRHDYTRDGQTKAGHEMLPAFALCQIRSSGQDIKNVVTNIHTVVCELSQHVLYQYILLVVWYVLVVGIIVSIIGLIKHFVHLVTANFLGVTEGTDVAHVYAGLTSREKEYMSFIRRKNMPVFSGLVKKLHDNMYNMPSESDRSSYDTYPEKENVM